jgi:hypothetical protein
VSDQLIQLPIRTPSTVTNTRDNIICLLSSKKFDSIKWKELVTFKVDLEYTRNTLDLLKCDCMRYLAMIEQIQDVLDS